MVCDGMLDSNKHARIFGGAVVLGSKSLRPPRTLLREF
jgi:hypothetical protein